MTGIPGTTAPVVPTAGVLAGGGSAMMHALVHHHPTPAEPLPELESVVVPVNDPDGTLRDWRMDLGKLLLNRDTPQHDLYHRYLQWRESYVKEALLGDVATVRAFLHWADRHTDISALHVLNLPKAKIDPRTGPRVAWQVHEAEAVCRARAEQGLGVTSPRRAGLIRGFVVGYEPLVVLADATAQVAATRAGFEVTEGGTKMLVHGWMVGADGVTVVGDDGPVPLGNALGGRLLAQLAPGVDQASAGPVPLSSVFSGLLHNLPEMAMLAARNNAPLIIYAGS